MFNLPKFPWSDSYRLNLDWILQTVAAIRDKVTFLENNHVSSVNGKTGAVVTPFTSAGNDAVKTFDTPSNADYFGFQRTLANGGRIQFVIKPDGHAQILFVEAGGTVHSYDLVNDKEIPTDAPVYSVNGKNGIVVLNASDVGAVSSVNNKYGAVTLTASDVGAVSSVNGQTGAVTLSASDVGAAEEAIVPEEKELNQIWFTGVKTHGSGYIEMQIALPANAQLRITSADLYKPNEGWVTLTYTNYTTVGFSKHYHFSAPTEPNLDYGVYLLRISGAIEYT